MFGTRIRQLRRQMKLTQQELADTLGVDNTTISVWELGKAEPSIKHILAMSSLFNVTTDFLLGKE